MTDTGLQQQEDDLFVVLDALERSNLIGSASALIPALTERASQALGGEGSPVLLPLLEGPATSAAVGLALAELADVCCDSCNALLRWAAHRTDFDAAHPPPRATADALVVVSAISGSLEVFLQAVGILQVVLLSAPVQMVIAAEWFYRKLQRPARRRDTTEEVAEFSKAAIDLSPVVQKALDAGQEFTFECDKIIDEQQSLTWTSFRLTTRFPRGPDVQ